MLIGLHFVGRQVLVSKASEFIPHEQPSSHPSHFIDKSKPIPVVLNVRIRGKSNLVASNLYNILCGRASLGLGNCHR